jgi:hypothetical protein
LESGQGSRSTKRREKRLFAVAAVIDVSAAVVIATVAAILWHQQ